MNVEGAGEDDSPGETPDVKAPGTEGAVAEDITGERPLYILGASYTEVKPEPSPWDRKRLPDQPKKASLTPEERLQKAAEAYEQTRLAYPGLSPEANKLEEQLDAELSALDD